MQSTLDVLTTRSAGLGFQRHWPDEVKGQIASEILRPAQDTLSRSSPSRGYTTKAFMAIKVALALSIAFKSASCPVSKSPPPFVPVHRGNVRPVI